MRRIADHMMHMCPVTGYCIFPSYRRNPVVPVLRIIYKVVQSWVEYPYGSRGRRMAFRYGRDL